MTNICVRKLATLFAVTSISLAAWNSFASGAKAPRYDDDVAEHSDSYNPGSHSDGNAQYTTDSKGHIQPARDTSSLNHGLINSFKKYVAEPVDRAAYRAGHAAVNGVRAAEHAAVAGARAVGNAALKGGKWLGSCIEAQYNKFDCPAGEAMCDRMANPKRYACGPYNQVVLSEMKKIPPGGGFDLHSSTGGFNLEVKAGHETVVPAHPGGLSHCSGGQFTLFMNTINQIDPGIFDRMNKGQKRNFRPDADYVGFFGAINGDHDGITDANRLVQFGDQINGVENACAGDFMSWDRKSNKFGHNGVFLGVSGNKTYYWASNKASDSGFGGGYSIRCENTNDMITKIVRLKYPRNLTNIESYVEVESGRFIGKNHKKDYMNKTTIKPATEAGIADLNSSVPKTIHEDVPDSVGTRSIM